eukprot:TRINITY_DN2351_c0_g1_i3.p1 TRINITY_DN2351_c0_g1~~TRINITY_DN2351_c0_g1_i3.p1  ORF type:complete len:120 (+),score=20.32 TRINITY_DN2351_c0_g1_i3:416-775(+)
MSQNEKEQFKAHVSPFLFYVFWVCFPLRDSGVEEAYSIISSPEGKRTYDWGVAQVENPKHSDVSFLRTFVINKRFQQSEKNYEKINTAKLVSHMFRDYDNVDDFFMTQLMLVKRSLEVY